MNKPFFHIFLIVAVGLLAYSNTLNVPFQFDDEAHILSSPFVKDLKNFIEMPDGTGFIFESFRSRYLGHLSFALNYRLHGLDVTGYHVVNLVIHVINALLVYWLVVITFRTPLMMSTAPYLLGGTGIIAPKREGNLAPTLHPNHSPLTTSLIALFSALLFVAHPVQTEAVTYISQRFTSLATMFYLLSLVFYIKWRLTNWNAEHVIQKPGQEQKYFIPKSFIWYLSSIICAVLAMKTKEIAFTLPIIITLYEFIFFGGKTGKRLLYLTPLLLTMLIIPLTLIGTSKPLSGLLSAADEATRSQTTVSRVDYLFTQFRVIVTYIRLLLLPINQNLDYDHPVYHSFLDPNVFLSFLFLLTILGFAVYLLFRSRFKGPEASNIPLVSFGIFWFFITLSVESSVIPIIDVVFEHRVYLPSVGAFVAASTLMFIIVKNLIGNGERAERAILLSMIVLTLAYASMAYARNIVWQDEVGLLEDTLIKSPQKARVHNNLGQAYSKRNLSKSKKHYQIALNLNPCFAEAYNNMGAVYAAEGAVDKAIEYYLIAINLKPNFTAAHFNLGFAYLKRGLRDKARQEFETVLQINPDDHEALLFMKDSAEQR